MEPRTPDPDAEPVPFDDKQPKLGGVNPGNTNNADPRLETDLGDDEDEDENENELGTTSTKKGVE